MSLATVADLQNRVGSLDATQIRRVEALLADASAVVRAHTGQHFTQVSGDTAILSPAYTKIRLPQRPVTAVTSVLAVSYKLGVEATTAVTDWEWDGIETLTVPGVTTNCKVVYSHGYTTIPEEVTAVVAGMVNRVLTSPTLAEGLTQGTVGQYGFQVQQATGSQGTGVRLSPADRIVLEDYRRQSGQVVLG